MLRLSQHPDRGCNANRQLRPSANLRSETRGSSAAGGHRPKDFRRLRRRRFNQNCREETERRGRDIAGTAQRSAQSVLGAVSHLRDAAQRATAEPRCGTGRERYEIRELAGGFSVFASERNGPSWTLLTLELCRMKSGRRSRTGSSPATLLFQAEWARDSARDHTPHDIFSPAF